VIQATSSWNGGAVVANLQAQSWLGIVRAVVFYWTQLQNALNVANPRPYNQPSAPGDPPRKRTGWLQRNVVYELNEQTRVAKVGLTANVPYGLWLEIGTRKMRPRPYLIATLNKYLGQMRILLMARQ
jgi:hypothetical protein